MILKIVSLVNTVEMDVDQCDSIEDVKDKICDHLTCNKNCFLIYKNIILKNNNRVGFYKICSNDEIWCGRIDNYMESDDIILDVFLTVWPWGELINLIVKGYDSIDKVRSILGAILSDIYRLVEIWDAHGETLESTQLINEIATCKGGRRIICKLDDGEIDLTFAEYCDMYDRHVANEFWWIHWKYGGKWTEDMRGQMKYIKEIVAIDASFADDLVALTRCLQHSRFLCCMSIANCTWHILHNHYQQSIILHNKHTTIPFDEYEPYFYVTLSIAVLDYLTNDTQASLENIVRDAVQYLTNYLMRPDSYWRNLLKLFCTHFWFRDHNDEEIDSMIDYDMQYLFVQINGSSDVVVPISSQIKTVLHFKKAISMEIGAALQKLYFIDKRSTTRPDDNDLIDVNNLLEYSCQIIMSMDDIEILRNIGQGAFGSVFLCQYKSSRERFVLKKPLIASDLDREVILHSRIDGCVRVGRHLGLFSDRGTVCSATEYVVAACTLDELVSKRKCLEEYEIARLSHQILMQIKEMHKKNVIHRDIKSGNILLDEHNNLKLIDFGISTFVNTVGKYHDTLSQSSINYMAPELIKGDAFTDKIDIWSFGVIVVEMLTGKKPYGNCLPHQALSRIAETSKIGIELPISISEELTEFIDSCLTCDPNNRATADKLIKSKFIRKYYDKIRI